ncbi:MAG: FixH family protein [Anaerolineae bacterium]|nr:FixH family protein [Anaerolineae bacterium]
MIPYQRLIVLIVVLILLTGCGRIQRQQTAADLGVSVEVAIDPDQPSVGPTRLIFTLTDAQGHPINDAVLDVEGNMTHAGMTPVLAQARAGQAGQYVVPFEWTMSGDWIVTLDVALADGRRFTHQTEVSVQ